MATNNSVNTTLSGQSGTGTFIGANTPTLITPVLGVATGTSLALSGQLSAGNLVPSFLSTATAGATTTLLVSSAQIQEFTGALTQTVVMPVTTTLVAGQEYYIINNSSGVVTINSSGANLIQALAANTSAILTCVLASGTAAASWQSSYIADGGGTVNSGTANQIGYYATTSNAISGLTGANSALLVTNSTGVPAMTASLTNGQLIIGSTGATPAPGTLTGGTGISITNTAGAITIDATGSGVATVTIAGTSQAAVVSTQYIALNAGQTTLTLPAVYAVGDVISLIGSAANTGGWVVTASAGDTVQVSTAVTSAGGTVICTAVAGQCISLVCDVANTSWVMTSTSSVLLTTA